MVGEAAQPVLQEAIYLGKFPNNFLQPVLSYSRRIVEIQCSETAIGGVYNCLSKRRGIVISDERRLGTPMTTIKAYLPVSESFGFNGDLRGHTSGQAFPQTVFDHWETMTGCECSVFSSRGDLVQCLIIGAVILRFS